MFLTKDEEKIYNGGEGIAREKAIKVIVKVGEALGAKKLVGISSAHASGLSFNTIGDPGLEFLEELASDGARASVISTLNCIGYDTTKDVLKLPNGFKEKQNRIIAAFNRMGFKPTLSCSPYYTQPIHFGDHVAWGESSAVAYANTIIGARTNREGGPLAVFAGILGKTYYAGLHVEENRKQTVLFDVAPGRINDLQASLIGLKVGEITKDGIPYIKGLRSMKQSSLRLMLAAMAASGSVGMALIEGISPEAKAGKLTVEKIAIDPSDFESSSVGEGSASELYFVGCPHASIDEMVGLSKDLGGKKVKAGKRFWIATGSDVYQIAVKLGVARQLLEEGIEIVVDTCPVVAPLADTFKSIATNSGKSRYYLSKVHGAKVRVMSTEKMIEEATR